MNLSQIIPGRQGDTLRNLFGAVRRRYWASHNRAHIELPDLQGDEYRDFARTVVAELEGVHGVIWARSNGALRRVIVTWEEDLVELEQLLEVFDQVEHRFNLDPGEYCDESADHPGDDEHLVRGLVRLASSALGTAAGMTMKVLRRKPGSTRLDLAALMSVVDNVPHIRNAVVDKMGRSPAEMSIGLFNPLIQGLGSGPVGPAIDFLYQGTLLMGAIERRFSWLDREPDLCSHPDRVEAPLLDHPPRPVPVPEGPIEAYADDAWNMSLGGFMVGLADTQKLERALTPILDALPKPARYGRGAFCASLSGVFADRGMVVMDPDVLERLDRVDCVIIDDRLLITDRWGLENLYCPQGDPVEAFQKADELLDPHNPEVRQIDGDWALGPADPFDIDPAWEEKLRQKGATGDLLALSRKGEAVALFSLKARTDRVSRSLVKAIKDAGLELIIASDQRLSVDEFHPDRVVERAGLHRFIRHIQRDFQVVSYIGATMPRAMIAADCSVGICREGKPVPWEAHILACQDMEGVLLVMDAIKKARQVSRRCATLAGLGAGIGALTASSGLEDIHPTRVMLSVNAASMVALIYGIFQGRKLKYETYPLPDMAPPWHRLRRADVLQRLDSTGRGIDEATARQRHEGPPQRPPRPIRVLKAIGGELANPLTPVLAAGAAVSAAVGSVTDAGIVGAVIAANGLIGGLSRFEAEDAIYEMSRREIVTVDVCREGRWRSLDDDRLVEGDLIRLEAGDVVPADCRILKARHLEVDESTLTGESLPVPKGPDPSFASNLADRTSMLYDGTAVVAGTVTAVVVATGEATEQGLGQRQTSPRSQRPTGVEARLQEFSELTIPMAGIGGGFLMSLGVLRHRKLKPLIGPAVNLAVAAVPEGLPLLSTAAQLAAARRLSERNVIVQNQSAMEALGGVDTLCIDKTGTLTEGRLRLHRVYDGAHIASPDHWEESHRQVLRDALRATPYTNGSGPLPHATDRAIDHGARHHGLDRGDWDLICELPFKSQLAFHASLGRSEGESMLVVKGSPEEVIPRCVTHRGGKLDDQARAELLTRGDRLAGRGLRLLAVASRQVDVNGSADIDKDQVDELTFRGFVALSDPLRESAAEAVKALRTAGVSLIMLTGDHPETARRIAREVGLDDGSHVVTGDDLDQMDDTELAEVLQSTRVIARMTPTQKVRIVEALQEAGRRVAMTGDGANDAAAIRLADAGIALGAEASTAARRAADLVVIDARIDTIVDALVEGRAMWRSVRDAVAILMGGNLGEIGFMLASGAVHTTPALNARQLLLVNLFTDVAPSLAIALRPPPDISYEQLLHEGPEESLGDVLDRDITWRAFLTASSSFAAWMTARYTLQRRRAPTVGLLTVVFAQLGQTLTVSRPSPAVWAAGIGSAAALLALVETPVISHLLGCKPLGPMGLTTAFSYSAAATAASAIIPRVPGWIDYIDDKLPTPVEPTPEDHLQDFFRATDHLATSLR